MIDLAVGVAGDVREHGLAHRLLVETVDGHDGEQLVDGPAVRQGLEDREIAEVGVGEDAFELVQLLRNLVQLARGVAHLRARRPVQTLRESAILERKQAELEHLQRLVARRQRRRGSTPRDGAAITVRQASARSRTGCGASRSRAAKIRAAHLEAVQRRTPQHVEDQHAVVGGDRATGFADDHRMLDAALIADAGDAIHHVVGVFDQRVVHRRVRSSCRCRRSRRRARRPRRCT